MRQRTVTYFSSNQPVTTPVRICSEWVFGQISMVIVRGWGPTKVKFRVPHAALTSFVTSDRSLRLRLSRTGKKTPIANAFEYVMISCQPLTLQFACFFFSCLRGSVGRRLCKAVVQIGG